MNRFGVFLVLATAVVGVVRSMMDQKNERERWLRRRDDLSKGFDQSVTQMPDGSQVVRFRGSYDDIMGALNPEYRSDKPPLPDDLDVESLPSYHCGCPHCGKMSVYGESMWRYYELSRTRGPWDNTTTFLAKCKSCNGFMKSTVDHDD